MTRVLAVVTARGGSKGLPRKNILPLAGKPLIAYTIEAALNAQCITDVVVSSDDEEILSVATNYGAKKLSRPLELAEDTTLSEPVVRHALQEELKNGNEYDFVALLQPTSPLRNALMLDKAFSQMSQIGAKSLISVVDDGVKAFKTFKVNDEGFLSGLVDNFSPFMRRQDLPVAYLANGAIYIVSVSHFLEQRSFLVEPCVGYEMTKESSLDIDSQRDMHAVEKILLKDIKN